jgi:hypothetical protein
MLLAAMLAMVLAAAAPALAQVTVAGDDNNAAQYVDCSQVQAALGAQYGDQNAAANDESVASAANELGITQNQVNACLGEVNDVNQGEDAVGDVVIDENGSVVAAADASAAAAAEATAAAAAAAGSASAASEGSAAAATETLPETGGASLLALGAGALLVAGGLLARRIVR